MKARLNKTVQLIDPEESTTNEDPLWAPSWELPHVDRETGEREATGTRFHAERDPLIRLGEAIEDDG